MNLREVCLFGLPLVIVGITSASWLRPGDEHDQHASTVAQGERAAAAVVASGDDEGYLEPCGCAGGLLGGLPRRHTYLGGLERKAEQRLLLSNGHLTGSHKDEKPDPDLSEAVLTLDRMKFETMLISMEQIGYHALNVSPQELKLGREALANALKDVSFPAIATNLRVEQDPKLPFVKGVRLPWTGGEVLVVGVIGESQKKALGEADPHVALEDPLESIKSARRELGEGLPLIVLARMTEQEARELTGKLDGVELVVLPAAAGSGEQPEKLGDGKPFFVTSGDKGKYLAVCFRDGAGAWRLDSPAMGEDYLDSPDILSAFQILRERMKVEKTLAHFYEQKSTKDGARYVGSSTCGNQGCHEREAEIWKGSGHAKAWHTLTDKGRTFDPDCVGCHVTGYTYQSGYAGEDKTPSLVDVTCEQCHGPASKHIEDTSARYGKTSKRECAETCHVKDHSPKFERDTYWQKIKHGSE
jgi:hypothetical protein